VIVIPKLEYVDYVCLRNRNGEDCESEVIPSIVDKWYFSIDPQVRANSILVKVKTLLEEKYRYGLLRLVQLPHNKCANDELSSVTNLSPEEVMDKAIHHIVNMIDIAFHYQCFIGEFTGYSDQHELGIFIGYRESAYFIEPNMAIIDMSIKIMYEKSRDQNQNNPDF
jgi:hypothetical protein